MMLESSTTLIKKNKFMLKFSLTSSTDLLNQMQIFNAVSISQLRLLKFSLLFICGIYYMKIFSMVSSETDRKKAKVDRGYLVQKK